MKRTIKKREDALHLKFGLLHYRVTKQLEPNLPLTSKQNLLLGLAWPGLAKVELLF